MTVARQTLRRRQRHAVALMASAGVLATVDRSALAIVNPLVRGEFGLSIQQMGFLLSAFVWTHAFCLLPAGLLVDRFRPRRIVGAAIAFWSVAQIFCGLATGFWGFAAARAMLATGEAPLTPGLVRLVRDWFPSNERSLPVSIGFAAGKLGPALAPLLITPLMLALGWRVAFTITGAAGLVLAAVWLLTYRDTDIATEAPDDQADGPGGLRLLLGYRASWGMAAGTFGQIYMSWLYLTWLPGYLEIERHLSLPTTGWVAGLPFAFSVAGAIGAGWFNDRLVSAGRSPIRSCKLPIIGGMLGTACFTVIAALTSSVVWAVAAMSIALLFSGMSAAIGITLATAMAPRRCSATLISIQLTGGYMGGALAPALTGLIVQQTGSFIPALLFSAAMGVTGAAIYLFVVPNQPIRFAADANALPV
jgi:MFS family permease